MILHYPTRGYSTTLPYTKLKTTTRQLDDQYGLLLVEILGDKAIEWLLDMIITNSNDIIVTLNNQGGTHGSDEL